MMIYLITRLKMNKLDSPNGTEVEPEKSKAEVIHHGLIGGSEPFVVIKFTGGQKPPADFATKGIRSLHPYVCCYNPDCKSQNDDTGCLVDVSMADARFFIEGLPFVPQVVHCRECDCCTLICKE